jgi:hypothetical protein
VPLPSLNRRIPQRRFRARRRSLSGYAGADMLMGSSGNYLLLARDKSRDLINGV